MGVESPKGFAEGEVMSEPLHAVLMLEPKEDNCCVNPKRPPSSTHRITQMTSERIKHNVLYLLISILTR